MQPTILHFHTGRGGRFHNPGHKTFCGTRNIHEVLDICDQRGHCISIKDRDENGRFCKKVYIDFNNNEIITLEEAQSGVGCLNWDNDYNTDTCIFLKDCGENELKIILASEQWNKNDLIEEYFNEHTDLKIEWKKFNGDYNWLIWNYFNFPHLKIDVTEWYMQDEV